MFRLSPRTHEPGIDLRSVDRAGGTNVRLLRNPMKPRYELLKSWEYFLDLEGKNIANPKNNCKTSQGVRTTQFLTFEWKSLK
jgi:hypothetical protein